MIHESETINRRSLEAAVVGSMVLFDGRDAAEFAATELSGVEFSVPEFRTLFRATCDMTASGKPLDVLTISEELAKRGELQAAIVAEVFEAVPHAGHIRYYVQNLQAQHQRDELQRQSDRQKRRAEDQTCDPNDTIEMSQRELDAIRAGNVRQSELKTAADALRDADELNNNPAKIIPTGISGLDRQLNGGIRGGQLIVVGGRPGIGKSTLMTQIVLHAAKSDRPGVIVSLEMEAAEIGNRALQTIGRQRFAELPVFFYDKPDVSKIVSIIRLAKRQHAIELACIDYLQLLESPVVKNELRERQVATICRRMKLLAMELKIPILLGSQLNRGSEKRSRPSLTDLRESGAIEQEGDVVILIGGEMETDERELDVAKQRNGPPGIVQTMFDRPRFEFSSQPFTGKL